MLPKSTAAAAAAVLLWMMLTVSPQVAIAMQPVLSVTGAGSYRNPGTTPNTVEMPHNQSWQFACRWTRTNVSETLFLAIEAPSQKGPCNCQFSTLSGPAVCTPSNVQFDADSGVQKSNLTCAEAGNTLTCSINFDRFNPHHIGAWSCKSLSDSKNDTIFLQYFKLLPSESLVLASWDPIAPSNDTGGSSNGTGNRFECFTKSAVIPPARLTYYLGGVELTAFQTRYPVDSLPDIVYTVQPNMYTFNASTVVKTLPRTDLALNQQLLASSRVLELRLRRAYNGLVLQCVANQGLSNAWPAASQGMVLHLDSESDSGSAASATSDGWQLPLLLSAALVMLHG